MKYAKRCKSVKIFFRSRLRWEVFVCMGTFLDNHISQLSEQQNIVSLISGRKYCLHTSTLFWCHFGASYAIEPNNHTTYFLGMALINGLSMQTTSMNHLVRWKEFQSSKHTKDSMLPKQTTHISENFLASWKATNKSIWKLQSIYYDNFFYI